MPKLFILATLVLGIPAASAASQQLFSIAGLVDTARRGQLNTETFELLLIQKVNQDILENENMRYVSEKEKSVDDSDIVGISKESAGDLQNQPKIYFGQNRISNNGGWVVV